MTNKQDDEKEILKTFDMYHFFSRKDVILMILFILLMLGVILFKVLFGHQVA